MKYRIATSRGAEADIDSVGLWYELTDLQLALRFLSETNATVERIRQFPYAFPLLNGAVRRATLKRFPYFVYYSVSNNEVFIITILHQRRSETVWRNRSHGQY
jgi:plasmid stabilization system protein ParE